MKNMTARMIAETAVGAALSVVFIMIGMYVPLFSVFAMYASGLPLMYLSCKNSVLSGGMAFVVAALVAFMLTGNVISLGIMLMSYTLPALAFGICVSKEIRFSISVSVVTAVTIIGVMLEILLLNGGAAGIENMVNSYMAQMQTTMTEGLSLGGFDLNSELSQILSESMALVKQSINLYLPTIIILIAFVSAYIIGRASVFVLKRTRVKSVPYTKFNNLRAPRLLCNMTVVLFIISFMIKDSNIYAAAIKNILLMSQIAIGICGFAFVDYKFSFVIKSALLRALIYVLIMFAFSILMPLVMDILVLVGFFTSMGRRGGMRGGEGDED